VKEAQEALLPEQVERKGPGSQNHARLEPYVPTAIDPRDSLVTPRAAAANLIIRDRGRCHADDD
jgi:hypothetical protein